MDILLVTDRTEFSQSLSGLGAFGHSITHTPLDITARGACRGAEAVLVDGSSDLPVARQSCRRIGAWAPATAVLAVVATEDFAAIDLDWHVDDVLVATAGSAEAHARIRLALQRRHQFEDNAVQFGDLVINPGSYSASLSGHSLDLTLTEFKLLHHLVLHAGQAFSRTRLLREIWGEEGGRRKVDVHIQRLRAKLGAEHESLVDTVRGVGYMTPRLPQQHWALAN